MKKLLIASALSAAFVSPAVFAQASNFAGFYGQVGIGYEYNTVKSSGPNYWKGSGDAAGETYTDVWSTTGSSSANNFSNAIGIGFGFAMTERILLSIGAEYQPLGGDTGDFDQTFFENGVQDGLTERNYYSLKNRYGIFLSPGYAIDDNKMAYVKLGYTGQTVEAKLSFPAARVLSTSKDVSGFMLGVGYRQLLNENVYFFAEANYRDYDKAEFELLSRTGNATNTSQPKSTNFNALVGIGARF